MTGKQRNSLHLHMMASGVHAAPTPGRKQKGKQAQAESGRGAGSLEHTAFTEDHLGEATLTPHQDKSPGCHTSQWSHQPQSHSITSKPHCEFWWDKPCSSCNSYLISFSVVWKQSNILSCPGGELVSHYLFLQQPSKPYVYPVPNMVTLDFILKYFILLLMNRTAHYY